MKILKKSVLATLWEASAVLMHASRGALPCSENSTADSETIAARRRLYSWAAELLQFERNHVDYPNLPPMRHGEYLPGRRQLYLRRLRP
jgi:hypothetical protein